MDIYPKIAHLSENGTFNPEMAHLFENLMCFFGNAIKVKSDENRMSPFWNVNEIFFCTSSGFYWAYK